MTMSRTLEALAAKIDTLSPAAKLIMASQLVEQAPDVAITIAQKAIDELTLAALLKGR
jgi:hypothetical protein